MKTMHCMLGLPMLLALLPAHAVDCSAQPAQAKTVAAIRQLEMDWSKAYYTGDSAFLECLYAPEFRSADTKGKLDSRDDDIAGSRKNIGKPWTFKPDAYQHEVWITANTAIATNFKGDDTHGFRVTDMYQYDGRRWHAIFSQDTKY